MAAMARNDGAVVSTRLTTVQTSTATGCLAISENPAPNAGSSLALAMLPFLAPIAPGRGY